MSKLKRNLIIVGSVLTVLVIAIVIIVNVMLGKINHLTETYNEFDFSSMDLSKVEDGTYIGSEDGSIVKASVEVTVKDHTITKVTILSHECGKGKPAEVIVDDIVEKNSLAVDSISGATYSCNILKMAVYNALKK